MDATTLTVTRVEWEDLQPCKHCSQRKEGHMEDGKCLFEASSFAPIPFPTEVATTRSWMYDALQPIRTGPPSPERTEYAVRKDRKLQQKAQQKAQKRGRCR
jgi:hypothetical protein